MIRLAKAGELDRIMEIVDVTRKLMNENGNVQWDERYPLRSDLDRDIRAETLYAIEKNGDIAGIICINREEPEEYRNVGWNKVGAAYVIHRMAVAPEYRGLGLADKLIDFAWKKTREDGLNTLRSDTFSKNAPMNALFKKHGFRFAGEVELKCSRQQPFYCYEK